MKSEANVIDLNSKTAPNREDDLRLTFLRSHHEMAARCRVSAGVVRNEAYRAYGAAADGLRRAEYEEDKIRDEVVTRYEELGLEVPAMYHGRDCDCATCKPF